MENTKDAMFGVGFKSFESVGKWDKLLRILTKHKVIITLLTGLFLLISTNLILLYKFTQLIGTMRIKEYWYIKWRK